ncbi:MAG: hypothetical protein R6W99_06650, partial [Clostridia bacterium]
GASIASPEAKFFSSGLGLNLYPFTAIHTKNSTAGIDILHPASFINTYGVELKLARQDRILIPLDCIMYLRTALNGSLHSLT